MQLRTLLTLAVLWAMSARPLAAQNPDDCAQLGAAITEHTCFHARFGPFEEVNATAGTIAMGATPNINQVHTHFRVHLTAETSLVTYTPKRSGLWAVYLDPDVPLSLLQDDEQPVAPVRVGDVEGCPFLLRVRVYDLVANQRYRFVLAPSAASQVVIVNEKIDDFVIVQARDADGDGYGDPGQTLVSACEPATGYVDNDGDCDDTDPSVHPAAAEICDGIDQNCNRVADDIGELCRSGFGACAAVGVWACPVPDAPAQCSATADLSQAVVESCNGEDDDCDGTVDDGDDALCALEADAPYCVDRGNGRACGCERDSDCGDAQSGRLCMLTPEAQHCVEGCVDGFGRNGCPNSMTCTSRDPANPGVCVAECEDDAGCVDAGVDAGHDAGAPPPDAGAGSDAGLDAGTPPPTPTDGGCRCNAVGQPRSPGAASWLWLVVPLGLWVRRARRRDATLLLVALSGLIVGCAQSQLAVGVDAGQDATPDATPPLDAGCVPALGAALIDHSCQHATLGRYVDVIATSQAQARPPWVNASHKAYRIAMPTRDLTPTAFVSYRPSRQGQHVVMLGPATQLQITAEDSGAAVPIRHQQRMTGCATELNEAHVVDLNVGSVYRLSLGTDDQRQRRLFIEHADTFGDRAWDRSCEPQPGRI